MTQHTSKVKSVTKGQEKQWDRMGQDFAASYKGGSRKLELAKGHPDVVTRVHRLFDELAAERELMLPIEERGPFMTVRIGTHQNVKRLRKTLTDAGNRISDWGSDILNRITLAKKPEDVNIVVVTVAELGFPNGATRAHIYEKALSMGLGLLPAEVGPQLRLQYPDQPLGEWILVGMEPITDSDGYLKVFYVEHNGNGRWLRGSYGYPGHVWRSDRRWAFRCK
ncbi:hypothetical protein A2V71_00140 [Candidatus Berkelbacteria bacterium RBG_13_40_8]|uniref:Uncharacterized protein n=1 Tax=Candidatus Berkelbacteria bacterium RBG_13_40_8 TaxID=1797467 RepID=A0A1F5DQR6_9BACT|nr:MAG: hypothetical protein A2V71_00140 [Candidatus Berkelbacteria bacterium RBG_13_40_8]